MEERRYSEFFFLVLWLPDKKTPFLSVPPWRRGNVRFDCGSAAPRSPVSIAFVAAMPRRADCESFGFAIRCSMKPGGSGGRD